jgi:hypothetical protein
MLKQTTFAVLAALVMLFLVADTASAGLGVGGAIIENNITPGTHFKDSFRVLTKDSDPPMDIHVEIFGYGVSLEGTPIKLNATMDKSPYSARTFINASNESFHLEPGGFKEIKLEGDIPSEVGSGGRYALAEIRSLPKGNATVGFALAIVVPIRLTISGSNITHKGEIENVTLEKPANNKRQKLAFMIKNTGNHHYKAKLNAVVLDKNGQMIFNATTIQPYFIIPEADQIVRINIPSDTGINPSEDTVNATLMIENSTILDTKEMQIKAAE